MIQKIALFDVDKTVIQKDSMFQFMFYGLKKKPASLFMLLPVLVNSVLYKLKWMRAEQAKSAYFRWIRFMDEEDLQHFFNTKIKPYIFPEALKEMTAKKREGYHILLVTASPYAYMKYFEQLNAVDGVIGTLLTMNGSRFTHRIEGKNRYTPAPEINFEGVLWDTSRGILSPWGATMVTVAH